MAVDASFGWTTGWIKSCIKFIDLNRIGVKALITSRVAVWIVQVSLPKWLILIDGINLIAVKVVHLEISGSFRSIPDDWFWLNGSVSAQSSSLTWIESPSRFGLPLDSILSFSFSCRCRCRFWLTKNTHSSDSDLQLAGAEPNRAQFPLKLMLIKMIDFQLMQGIRFKFSNSKAIGKRQISIKNKKRSWRRRRRRRRRTKKEEGKEKKKKRRKKKRRRRRDDTWPEYHCGAIIHSGRKSGKINRNPSWKFNKRFLADKQI